MTATKPAMAAVPSAPPVVAAAQRPPAVNGLRSNALAPVRRFAARLSREWVPQAAWYVGRTGRSGLIGLMLLAASAVFFFSTHQQVAGEVASLRNELAAARQDVQQAPRGTAAAAAQALRNLPQRIAMPALLGVILKQADKAELTLDAGKYETSSTKNGDITRYKVSFPVTAPYPQVRKFIDATLTALPSAAISDLKLARKSVTDGNVEAEIRLTLYTRNIP